MRLLYEKNRKGAMRRKKVKKLVKMEKPMNAIYDAFSPQQRAAFKRFAALFGYSEERIRGLLKDERECRCDN